MGACGLSFTPGFRLGLTPWGDDGFAQVDLSWLNQIFIMFITAALNWVDDYVSDYAKSRL